MKFWIFLFLIFNLDCKSPQIILKEPVESVQPGLVSFGLFIVDDTAFTLFEKNAEFKVLAPTHTFFYSIDLTNSEIDPNSKFIVNPAPTGENIEINGKLYNEKKRLVIKNDRINYFLFSNLKPEIQYVLGSTAYSYTTVQFSVRGRRRDQINYVDIPLPLTDLSKTLNFKVILDEISFLGNFVIKVEVKQKGIFLDFNENKIGTIERAEDFLKNSQNQELIKSLYGGNEISEKNAEIVFLKKLLSNSLENGYWAKKVKERLKQISEETKN